MGIFLMDRGVHQFHVLQCGFYNHYTYLRKAENLVAHATETKNVPKLVPWLKQKISDFCGSNVGIFK